MDLFQRFLITVVPINLIEIFAAIVGSYYLYKNKEITNANKYLVYFLWFTVIIEILAFYPSVAYFTEYKIFGFTKDTLFKRNFWLFNIYSLISYTFYLSYFTSLLTNEIIRKRWRFIISLYLFIGVIVLFATDIFFKGDSKFTSAVGSILLLIIIVTFYLNLLKNKMIISLKRYLPIYISIGLLFFNLCITPLSLFSQYFISENELFVSVKTFVFLITNIFMYTTFIIGFWISLKKIE